MENFSSISRCALTGLCIAHEDSHFDFGFQVVHEVLVTAQVITLQNQGVQHNIEFNNRNIFTAQTEETFQLIISTL